MKSLSLYDYLVAEPRRRKNFHLALFRLSQILHVKTAGYFDYIWHAFARLFKRKLKFTAPSKILNHDQLKESVKALHSVGWKILDYKLSPSSLEKIIHFINTTPAYTVKKSDASLISFEKQKRYSAGRYMWKHEDIVQLDEVQKLIRDPGLHQLAQEYLGCCPFLSSVSLWLDTIQDQSIQEHVFHFDLDGPKFLKIFFYISDVDIDSGAHIYIQKTHSHVKPKAFRTSKRYTDEELLNFFGEENKIVFTGPAGTIFAEDTMGFHRGTTPKTGNRLVMQFEYGLFDNLEQIEANEVHHNKTQLPDLDPAVKKIVSKFYK